MVSEHTPNPTQPAVWGVFPGVQLDPSPSRSAPTQSIGLREPAAQRTPLARQRSGRRGIRNRGTRSPPPTPTGALHSTPEWEKGGGRGAWARGAEALGCRWAAAETVGSPAPVNRGRENRTSPQPTAEGTGMNTEGGTALRNSIPLNHHTIPGGPATTWSPPSADRPLSVKHHQYRCLVFGSKFSKNMIHVMFVVAFVQMYMCRSTVCEHTDEQPPVGVLTFVEDARKW